MNLKLKYQILQVHSGHGYELYTLIGLCTLGGAFQDKNESGGKQTSTQQAKEMHERKELPFTTKHFMTGRPRKTNSI